MSTTTENIGHITQVIGSTFDVEFAEDRLPAIYNAVRIQSEHKGVKIDLAGEVQQHLGGGRVRCIALGGTDGLIRGQDVLDTGKPVSVPVGEATLGRVFNVTGDAVVQSVRDIGNGRVGKTQLCNRLRGLDFEHDSDSTHGITLASAAGVFAGTTCTSKPWWYRLRRMLRLMPKS